jgi:hypothetical protein
MANSIRPIYKWPGKYNLNARSVHGDNTHHRYSFYNVFHHILQHLHCRTIRHPILQRNQCHQLRDHHGHSYVATAYSWRHLVSFSSHSDDLETSCIDQDQ